MTTTTYNFTDIVNFTRASSATYTNSSGLVTVTPASKNLFTYTQELNSWSKTNTKVSVYNQSAPDGTPGVDKIIATVSNNYHSVYKSVALGNATYTFSVFAKKAEYSKLYLSDIGLGRFAASFDLNTGMISNTGGSQYISSACISAGDGWFRCSITFNGNSVSPACSIIGYPSGAALNTYGATYIGDGGSGIYAWGGQLEVGSVATSYTKNYGSVYPPRFDYDPVTLQPKGLLMEEQRTNLVTYSEYPNGVSDAPSRGGLISATTFAGLFNNTGLAVGYNGTTLTYAYKAVTVTANTTYTISVFVRMTDGNAPVFNSAIDDSNVNDFIFVIGGQRVIPTTYIVKNFGGGLYRVSAVFTTTATPNLITGILKFSTNSTRTFSFSGLQLELGSFITSYIPTVASTVTRAADIASVTGFIFSSFYNQTEGTIVAIASTTKPTNSATAGYIIECNDNTNNNRNLVGFSTTIALGLTVVSGVPQASIYQTYIAGATEKMAYAIKDNNFAFALNGNLVGTDTNGTVPVVNQSVIGGFSGSSVLNGHIRSITYYPYRLSNSQLQSLTA